MIAFETGTQVYHYAGPANSIAHLAAWFSAHLYFNLNAEPITSGLHPPSPTMSVHLASRAGTGIDEATLRRPCKYDQIA
ncbi:hypothetical protein AB595_17910 [Massilia sp. WF1]|uniref:hypothetical protein n=1 Tax=unclassified Massilia TaxID=2609279 RepID=UPI00064A3233|nr:MULTISPECIES: hypothetical protein [unclassified Massilia]ALK98135.1 hypothetical protein AM586_20045 [Massilia sp. WG5]KLU35608.1 hypothetical protein AB595_17910 [Massilia sp. WF1]